MRIGEKDLTEAQRIVENLPSAEKIKLLDSLLEAQPLFVRIVMSLTRSGAPLDRVDAVIGWILVVWHAMQLSGHSWAVVDERHFAEQMNFAKSRIGNFQEGKKRGANFLVGLEGDFSETYLFAYLSNRARKYLAGFAPHSTDSMLILTAFSLAGCISVGESVPGENV